MYLYIYIWDYVNNINDLLDFCPCIHLWNKAHEIPSFCFSPAISSWDYSWFISGHLMGLNSILHLISQQNLLLIHDQQRLLVPGGIGLWILQVTSLLFCKYFLFFFSERAELRHPECSEEEQPYVSLSKN